MSYPINQPITYTAVAATQGQPLNTFAYAWAFDDNTTANTATYAKTWSTVGNRLATVTATDNTTGGTAVASKTITLGDWSTFSWTSTGIKIIPDASPSFGASLGAQATNLIVTGNLIVNVFDYNTPQTLVVFNTTTLLKNEYSGLLGTVGSPVAAFLLDSGPNSGSILIVGSGTGRYGFFTPSTGAFTTSPQSLPGSYPPNIVSLVTTLSAKMGNGKWFLCGQNTTAGTLCFIYDPVADSWATASASGVVEYMQNMFTLPSGNIFAWKDNTTTTYLYNYSTNTWSPGPTAPSSFPKGASPIAKLNDGRLVMVTSGAAPVQATWKEGDPAFVLDTEPYPFLSQSVSATGNYHQTLLVTPDGMVINVGGQCTGTLTQDDSVTVFHMPDGSWVAGAALLTHGISYKQCFANGRAWRSNTGILEYSSVW